jgi:hypothetical protein
MSWMDSWSRPSKHTATPPPLYLLPGGEATPYCHSCGRVIGSRKVHGLKTNKDVVKYCSERCRHRKPNETDRRIEDTFVSLLNAKDVVMATKNALPVKGEPRITVLCGVVEEIVFGPRYDPEKVFGRKKNRAKRGVPETGEWKSVDMEDNTIRAYNDYSADQSGGSKEDTGKQEFSAIFGAGKARPAQTISNVNFSVGGERGWAEKIDESEELKEKRLEGQRRAEEREAVRCAARRLCAFGAAVAIGEADREDGEDSVARAKQRKGGERKRAGSETIAFNEPDNHENMKRKCEAVLKGIVVEASFAKGEWGVRWRE